MNIHFVAASGAITDATGGAGERLLDVAQAAGQPLEGTCDGAMACATCHVVIDPPWFALLPPASDAEEDMLDLAPRATRTSRLACQVILDDRLDGLRVTIPA